MFHEFAGFGGWNERLPNESTFMRALRKLILGMVGEKRRPDGYDVRDLSMRANSVRLRRLHD